MQIDRCKVTVSKTVRETDSKETDKTLKQIEDNSITNLMMMENVCVCGVGQIIGVHTRTHKVLDDMRRASEDSCYIA